MKKNGFTLVELLVAIAIISILSVIAAVVYSGITAKVRDNQRMKDLQTIKQSLELYKGDIHNYPDPNIFLLNGVLPLTSCTGMPQPCIFPIIYLQQVPVDSDSSRSYYYWAKNTSDSNCDNTSASSACLNFILCAKKESSNTFPETPSGCSSASCGTAGNCDIGISSQ